MNILKAPSLSSLLSTTDRGSNDSPLGSLNLDSDELEELPSLDAVMSEIDSLEDSSSNLLVDNKFSQTPTPSFDGANQAGSILSHIIYQGITAQIGSAADRTEAGFASAIAVSRMVAVGTSHGFVLAFDNKQALRWCCLEGQQKQQGSVASLSFNTDDTRLLAGFSRGGILMINTLTGDVLRLLLDAVSPNAGVLIIKWTSLPTLALALDSGGSVWSLSFTRRMGLRGCNSKCLFSGSRGEVCSLEPLILNDELHPLQQNHTLVALATLSKFFILMIRPRLKVVKYHMLNGPPDSLPLLHWQMVLIQSADSSRSVDPVLATGRGSSLYFHQLTFLNGRLSVTFLRNISLDYNLLSLHWIGSKNIVCIERNSEMLHLIDVRTSSELESIDVSSFGIVYSSANYKGIATGGNVSPALALAGSYACYSSIVVNDDGTLYILGKRSLHGVKVRSWNDRLSYLSSKQNWKEAFELAVKGYNNTREKPRRLFVTKERILQLVNDYLEATKSFPEMALENVMMCLIETQETELLWQDLWERLDSKELYLNIITQFILDENLTMISPIISQALLDYWSRLSVDNVEEIILKLNWQCLDLHQALSLVKNLRLYRALMHLNTKALGDYTVSLVDLIPLINENDASDRILGNNLLVYISSCLAGRGYPNGDIAIKMVSTVKYEVIRTLTAPHSINAVDNELPYPFLRALLAFDTRETLNVLSLAFMENEFSTELGLSQCQRIINILLEIVDESKEEEFGTLCNFISQTITTKSLPDSSVFLTKIVHYITSDSNNAINSRQHAEKEQTFVNLMESNSLDSLFTNEELLEIAYRKRFFIVARFILERIKKYDKIVECLILSNNNYELFRYIMEYKNNDERKIYHQISENFQSLLEIDCPKISNFIIEYYPICVPNFLKIITDIPKLHYNFLKSLISNGSIPLEEKDYNVFLSFMIEYDPSNVLEFLQNSNHSYDVNYAMHVVENRNLTTSVIFLNEKMGKYQEAYMLAMKVLKEIPSEDQALIYASKAIELCMRLSHDKISQAEAESYWFQLVEVILSKNYLHTLLKDILHLASNSVDLTHLVQMIMRSDGFSKDKSFGDIKHILIEMLSSFEYQSLLLRTSQNIFSRDLHRKLLRHKQSAEIGVFCKTLKCYLCKRFLTQTAINATEADEDLIIVNGLCGHSIHKRCCTEWQEKVDQTAEIGDQTMKCKLCGLTMNKDAFHLNKTNWEAEDDMTMDLHLKSPTLDYKSV